MIRRIAGVIAGIVVANLFIFGWEAILPHLPFGRGPDPADAARPGFVAALSSGAKAWIVAGWLSGSFAGALVAFRIARWDYAGWIVAALVAVAGLANVLTIAHPLWMSLAAVVLPFLGAVFAFGASRRWRAADLHLR